MSTHRHGSPVALACGAVVAIALGSTPAWAAQVVVFDQTWDHTPDLADSHFRMPPAVETPADWVNPVDYSQGSAWVYLEVHTKPTAQETKFQVCFEANPTYACTAQSPTYTEVGTYEWETPFSGFWSPPGEYVDWAQGVNNIACILKDTMNGKPSADNVGPEVAALYTPTEVRLVVTIVEAGSVYEPPTPTGAGTGGSSSGGDGGTSGGDSSGGSSDGGVDPSATTGAPGDGSAGDGVSATAGAEDTGAGPVATGDSSSGAPADDESSGCVCRSSTSSSRSAPWLLVVLALRRRARAQRISSSSMSKTRVPAGRPLAPL
jgi:hypothetical protein